MSRLPLLDWTVTTSPDIFANPHRVLQHVLSARAASHVLANITRSHASQ